MIGNAQGGKNRRRGKNENEDEKRELVFKEDGQGTWLSYRVYPFMQSLMGRILVEYAQVIKMLGNGRLEAMCFDGEKRLAHIRGKMRKKASNLFTDCVLLGKSRLTI